MSSENGSTGHPIATRVGYAVTIVVNLFLLFVFHNLLAWRVPFITERWNLVLWALDLSVGATIVANALYIAYDARWFKRLTQLGLNLLALLVLYLFYTFFPFDFAGFMHSVARIALLFAMVGVVIATIVEGVSLLLGR